MLSLLVVAARPHPRGSVRLQTTLADAPKQHKSTVALIPPEEAWPSIQAVRYELYDKGLYRWPPHINLLYPFVHTDFFPEAIQALVHSTRACEPFELTLDSLGVFGGRARGVLYCQPSSTAQLHALRDLQATLQSAVPHCSEQQRNGVYTPHLTLSHFPSRAAAEAARDVLAPSWNPVSFSCERAVHVLRRLGDGGQFERAFTLQLGVGTGAVTEVMDPPQRFAAMPEHEADWVRQARKDAYKPGGRGGRGTDRLSHRVTSGLCTYGAASHRQLHQVLPRQDVAPHVAIRYVPRAPLASSLHFRTPMCAQADGRGGARRSVQRLRHAHRKRSPLSGPSAL